MLKFLILKTKFLRYWVDDKLYRMSYKRDKNTLSTLKDQFYKKPVLIVGNGPSLNITPLDDFKSAPSIGMNKIDLLYDKYEWRPNFVVCVNNLVVKQHWQKMLDSKVPIFLGWKCRWMLPFRARSSFNFFNLSPESLFQSDFSQIVGSGSTVTYTALQLAFYIGADPVIIVGVDHSFKVDGEPQEIQKRKTDDVNHFHPDYFEKGQYWGVPNLVESEKEYELARNAFEQDGRRIFDATVGGRLNVFEKINIKEAIKLLKV